jgi:hypothetical protein
MWTYLRSHPDLVMPEMKEPEFFIREKNWCRGLDWYRSLFAERTDRQIAGEASPGYSAFPIFTGVPERIATIVPEVKIIYLIREPVERMVSAWVHSRFLGHDDQPLRRSLLTHTAYTSQSQYALQLERYLEYFDREAILVVRSEDLAADPIMTMKAVCVHIGVDPGKLNERLEEHHNVGADKLVPRRRTLVASRLMLRMNREDLWFRLMTHNSDITHRTMAPSELELDDELRQTLRSYLLPDMQRLRGIVGPDMDLWDYA